ncbi:MAG: MBL fold metallo-hydrolase [Desulfobacteraceae bacterium]
MKINSKWASCLILLFVFLLTSLGAALGQSEVKDPAVKPDSSQKGIEISVVIDNIPYDEKLDNPWGFSCLVRGTEKTILFDTGPWDTHLLDNMRKMNIRPKEVDVVVLSHNHKDHTGGLQGFLKENHDVTVYLPKSFPEYFKEQAAASGAKVVEVGESLKICDRVYSTGEMEGFAEEQSLVVHSEKGTIVITGCAHPGIVSILSRAQEIAEGDLLLAMGGFHLTSGLLMGGPSSDELQEIVSSFKNLKVRYVGPTHCSGNEAMALFKKVYQEHYLKVGSGRVIYVNDLK